MRQRLVADMAGRVYPGGGGFADLVIIPATQAALMAGAVGVCVGCLCWLSIAAAYALPVGVFFGCAAFVVAFPMMMQRAGGGNIVETFPQGDDADEHPVAPFEPVILVGGKPASAVTPTAQRNAETPGRFAEFVRACAVDTGRERLESLGFGREEVNYYRQKLMQAGLAKFRTANVRNGWTLTAPADAIVGGVGMDGMDGDIPMN